MSWFGPILEWTRRPSRHLVVALISAGIAISSFTANAARFIPLGDLPGGDSYSYATAISADGSTVVGNSMSATGFDAFKWTEATGMVRLGTFGTNGVTDATSVSGDGKIIVGNTYANIDSYTDADPFMYTDDGGFTFLSGCGCHGSRTNVTISDDGTTIVGSRDDGGTIAYRWTAQTGPISLGDFPGGNNFSQAMDLTPDGSIIVGTGNPAPPGAHAGFQWTEDGGMQPLGSLMYATYAVSADGSAMAGVGFKNGQGAVRWTAEEGAVWLGNLPGLQGQPAGGANDISADGTVIVGGSGGDYKFEAFRWTSNSGILRIKTILEQHGVDMTGWKLQSANAISADGSVIVGQGTNPQGNTEGWIAMIPANYVPEPASSVIVALGLLATCGGFRKKQSQKSAPRPLPSLGR